MQSLPSSSEGHRAPSFELIIELEELPYCRILAGTAEDEERLRIWLASDQVRDRVRYHIENALSWASA